MQGYSGLTFNCLGASAAGFEWQTLQTTARRRPVLRGSRREQPANRHTTAKPLRPVAPHKAIALKGKPPRRHARGCAIGSSALRVCGFALFALPTKPTQCSPGNFLPDSACRLLSPAAYAIPCKAALVAAIRCASGRQSRRPYGARAAGRQAPCPPLYGGPLPSLWPQTSAGKAVCRPLKGVNLCRRRLRRLLVRG